MKTVDQIKDDVAWMFGNISWSCVEDSLKNNTCNIAELNQMIDSITRNYSREAEKFYESGDVDVEVLEEDLEYLTVRVKRLEDELEDVEMDLGLAEDRVSELEMLLWRNNVDYV